MSAPRRQRRAGWCAMKSSSSSKNGLLSQNVIKGVAGVSTRSELRGRPGHGSPAPAAELPTPATRQAEKLRVATSPGKRRKTQAALECVHLTGASAPASGDRPVQPEPERHPVRIRGAPDAGHARLQAQHQGAGASTTTNQ
jgi:hypothetical protein